MDVSINREIVDGRPRMAVHVCACCVRSGLTEQEAVALMAELLNGELARPKPT